jgi:hypothetical protein
VSSGSVQIKHRTDTADTTRVNLKETSGEKRTKRKDDNDMIKENHEDRKRGNQMANFSSFYKICFFFRLLLLIKVSPLNFNRTPSLLMSLNVSFPFHYYVSTSVSLFQGRRFHLWCSLISHSDDF